MVADTNAARGFSFEPLGGTLYLAAAGFDGELREELGDSAERVVEDAPLYRTEGPARPVAWAANTWLDPVRVRFGSIVDGASALRSLGALWVHLPAGLVRRARLIADNLPPVSAKPLAFPTPPPSAPLGSWTLLAPDLMIAAARCTSPFPHGEARFVEDHVRPPSRAYLKLWEALTVAGVRPKPGDRCVDLGSSPGGWTWALERIGARVVSVDKAPIAPALLKLTRVRYVQDSAFAIDPAKLGRVDWVFSDVICYPARLRSLVERWLAAHPRAGFVTTIKLQGPTDMASARDFAAIPGSRVVHLHHNRHELTWIRVPPPEPSNESSP